VACFLGTRFYLWDKLAKEHGRQMPRSAAGTVAWRGRAPAVAVLLRAAGDGVRKSGQRPFTYIAATGADRSVPGRNRRVRVAQDACTESRPW